MLFIIFTIILLINLKVIIIHNNARIVIIINFILYLPLSLLGRNTYAFEHISRSKGKYHLTKNDGDQNKITDF